MTASTEHERAEFEEWAKTVGLNLSLAGHGLYAHVEAQAAWMAWTQQAAHRAPAVPLPKGWKLAPEIPTQSMCDAAKYQVHVGLSVFKWADGYSAMLAAAPQPPEADHIPDAGKMVAAPVQLPENLREGEPYDNPAFEALARALGVWGTAQSAVCAQFWIAAKEQST